MSPGVESHVSRSVRPHHLVCLWNALTITQRGQPRKIMLRDVETWIVFKKNTQTEYLNGPKTHYIIKVKFILSISLHSKYTRNEYYIVLTKNIPTHNITASHTCAFSCFRFSRESVVGEMDGILGAERHNGEVASYHLQRYRTETSNVRKGKLNSKCYQ